MFQTQETDERLDMLEQVAILMEDKIGDDIAMDVVGSVNVGLSEESSDIDFVLYLRCDSSCTEGFAQCERYRQAEAMIGEILGTRYKAEILDCVDLNLVEKSIREKNYECETTQRFVSYRSLCRPINYRVIAPIEDLLNQDMDYRQELEGSIRSYFKIFVTTSQHVRSFQQIRGAPERHRHQASRFHPGQGPAVPPGERGESPGGISGAIKKSEAHKPWGP